MAYGALGAYDRVLALSREIQEQQAVYPIPAQDLIRLYCLEADAMRGRDGNLAEAESYLLAKIAEHPGTILLIDTLGRLYVVDGQRQKALDFVNTQLAQLPDTPERPTLENDLLLSKVQLCDELGLLTQANQALDQILSRNPDHQDALLYKGVIAIKEEHYDQAIPHLDRLLGLAPDAFLPRLNRAIAHLKSGELDSARTDYLQLLEAPPNAFLARVHYGLGEIAWTQKDYKTAAKHYEAYLDAAYQPDPNELREVNDRLDSIESGKL